MQGSTHVPLDPKFYHQPAAWNLQVPLARANRDAKEHPHARKHHQPRIGLRDLLGGFLVVWGAVSLGLAIREQQGGSQIASAISTIAGGAIIIAAAVYFGMLDTSWLPA